MSQWIVFGLVVALIAPASALYRSWLAQAETRTRLDCISCPKFIPVLAIAAAAFFVVASLFGLAKYRDPRLLLFVLIGSFGILLFLPMLIRSEVRIEDGWLSGPATAVGPFFGFGRTRIQIADIVAEGRTKSGYTYYEGSDGRRVYVSDGYPGSLAFRENLEAMRGKV